MKSLIDTDQFLSLVVADAPSFIPIIEDFKVNAEDIFSSIESSLKEGQRSEMDQVLHQLKGSSGTLGMRPLSDLCKEMESANLNDITENHLITLKRLTSDSATEALRLLDNMS